MGTEPSEQTSKMVAPTRVRPRPSRLGPNHCAKSSGLRKALNAAATTSPNISQRSTIRVPRSPLMTMSASRRGSHSMVLTSSREAGPKRKFTGRSTWASLAGIRPVRARRSNARPVVMATTSDRPMKAMVQPSPMRPTRMKVRETEFHGLAMRNAMTCPALAPRW
jgi:hypothetical protein